MTLFDLLTKVAGGPATSSLVRLLNEASEYAPDLKPIADQWLKELQAALSPEALAELAKVLAHEVGEIAQGHIKPADHASDSI